MCQRRLTCEAGGLSGSRLFMQIFVVLLADIRESACADAGKRHEGFLLPRHSLRQILTLGGTRGFVTSFSALGVCLHSHPLPASIARSNVPPRPNKSKTSRNAPGQPGWKRRGRTCVSARICNRCRGARRCAPTKMKNGNGNDGTT